MRRNIVITVVGRSVRGRNGVGVLLSMGVFLPLGEPLHHQLSCFSVGFGPMLGGNFSSCSLVKGCEF